MNTAHWKEVTNAKLIKLFTADCELGRGFDVVFYEHPQRGDMAPVYAKVDGKFYNTLDFDIPDTWA